MNKKLKTYAGLFIFSILFSFTCAIITPDDNLAPIHINYRGSHYHCDDDLKMSIVPNKTDTTDVVDNAIVANNEQAKYTFTYDVNLEKCTSTSCMDNTIAVANSTTRGELQIKKARLIFPTDSINNWVFIPMIIAILALTAWIVWVFIMALRTVRNIRNGNIFVSQVVKDIMILGKTLTIYFIVSLAVQISIYCYASSQIHLGGYQVVFGIVESRTIFMLGTGLMLLSQIIGMGKDLKEESELTI